MDAEQQFEQWFKIIVDDLGKSNLEESCGYETPWEDEWGQSSLLAQFPPSGKGLERICEGHPHGDEVLARLLELFQVAAQPDEYGGSSFESPQFDESVGEKQIQTWLLEYAANMRRISELAESEDGVNGAGNPPQLVRSDDLDNSFGLTISFFAEMHEDKFGDSSNPLVLLTEPLYESGGCSYIAPSYVLWPISRGQSPLVDPFRPAFELWKHGVDWAYPKDGVIHYGWESP